MQNSTPSSEFTQQELADAILGGAALDAFLSKKFGGETFRCKFCGAEIPCPGMCDACAARQEATGDTVEEKLISLGVPIVMSSCGWDNFDSPKGRTGRLVDELKRWRGRPALVVLSGPPGTGKTHMAAAMLRQRVTEKGSGGVVWIADADIATRLKAGFRSEETPLEDILSDARLLIVDDFGQTYQSQWLVETVMPLICKRIDNGKPTVITTNLTHEDIKALDARLASRMHTALTLSTRELSDRRGVQENG